MLHTGLDQWKLVIAWTEQRTYQCCIQGLTSDWKLVIA